MVVLNRVWYFRIGPLVLSFELVDSPTRVDAWFLTVLILQPSDLRSGEHRAALDRSLRSLTNLTSRLSSNAAGIESKLRKLVIRAVNGAVSLSRRRRKRWELTFAHRRVQGVPRPFYSFLVPVCFVLVSSSHSNPHAENVAAVPGFDATDFEDPEPRVAAARVFEFETDVINCISLYQLHRWRCEYRRILCKLMNTGVFFLLLFSMSMASSSTPSHTTCTRFSPS